MSWSYSGNPEMNKRDAVRFEIGDTISHDQQFSDEELEYIIDKNSSILSAALHCCDVLARRYARQADVQLGPQRVYASQRSEAYRELARELRSRMASGGAPLGNQESEGAFSRGLMSHPGGGTKFG